MRKRLKSKTKKGKAKKVAFSNISKEGIHTMASLLSFGQMIHEESRM